MSTEERIHSPEILPTVDLESTDELTTYLRSVGRIGGDEVPTIRTLRGGVSNKTVILRRANGSAWVLKQALSKLRVERDWFSDPARVHIEAESLRYLPRITPPGATPALVFEDPAQHLLAMEAVPEPHENWKTCLLRGAIDFPLIQQFGRLLAMIHVLSHEQAGTFSKVFRDTSFFETLRLEPYYLFTANMVSEAERFLVGLVEETQKTHLTLVHGDYSPKNVLVYQKRLVLLDHEVVHFGDPAFDLGFSLTHLLSKALHLPNHRARLLAGARAYWEAYQMDAAKAPWFENVAQRASRHTLACLLARTAGRSPLEYLSDAERIAHRATALTLLTQCPATVSELIESFGALLKRL
jgi:5-methylthioribose kinase